jgi:predicted amidophosphoribosyltransferase
METKICDVCGLEFEPIEPTDTVCEHCGEAMLEAWNEEEE